MGFLDKILKGLGFEGNDDEPPKKEKKQKTNQASYNGIGAEYNFTKEKEEEKKLQEEKENELNVQQANAGVVMKNPTTQEDIQNIIDEVKDGATVIVNLTGFSAPDRIRALDFLAGSLYTLKGSLQPLEGNLYLISNEN